MREEEFLQQIGLKFLSETRPAVLAVFLKRFCRDNYLKSNKEIAKLLDIQGENLSKCLTEIFTAFQKEKGGPLKPPQRGRSQALELVNWLWGEGQQFDIWKKQQDFLNPTSTNSEVATPCSQSGRKRRRVLKIKLEERSSVLDLSRMEEVELTFEQFSSLEIQAFQEILRRITGDDSLTILRVEKGSIILVLEGASEGLDKLEELFKTGQLKVILDIPVLDVRAVPQDQTTAPSSLLVHLSNWFQRNIVEGWEYETGLLGTLLTQQVNPAFVSRSADATRGMTSASQTDLLNELNSENQESSFQAALELGERGDASPEVIAALINRLQTCDNEETCWQIALSLGKLAPNHPQTAIAQRKEMPLGELTVELLVALKHREDENLDTLLQLYSTEEEYLPSELKLTVLNESGDAIANIQAQNEDSYIYLSFVGSLGKQFTVQISLEDDTVEEYFLV